MTSVFSEEGKSIPCTLIQAGPNVVTQLRTMDTDGYRAVQLAAGERKEKNTSAALRATLTKQIQRLKHM